MTTAASTLYQGRDWVTSRWAMAESFETLERIQDLCLDNEAFQTTEGMEEAFSLLNALHPLVESLTNLCAIAIADVIPASEPIGGFDHLWHAYEAQRLLGDLNAHILDFSGEDSDNPFGSLCRIAESLKICLRKLDQ